MAYRRGKFYYYALTVNGRRLQFSTRQSSKIVAIAMEREHRQRIAAASPKEVLEQLRRVPANASFVDVINRMYELLDCTLANSDAFSVNDRHIAHAATELDAFRRRIDQHLRNLAMPSAGPDGVVARSLTPHEQERLLAALKGKHEQSLKLLVPLLLFTGMWIGKALSLTWGLIDLQGKTLRVVGWNGRFARRIPLPSTLITAITEYRAWFQSSFGKPKPHDSVFRTPINTLKAGWTRLKAEAEIDCTFHDLQTTFVAGLLEPGVRAERAVCSASGTTGTLNT